MDNFEPAADWTNNDRRSKVERVHGYLGIMYGFFTALMGLGLLLVSKNNVNYWEAGTYFIVLLALTLAHFRTRTGIEDRKGWAIGASAIVLLLPLIAFPIGTIIAVFAYYNLLNMDDE